MNHKVGSFELVVICVLLLLKSTNSTLYFSENDIPEFHYLDTSADPCEDFHQFACGNFGKFNSRPLDQNIVDQFTLLQDRLVRIGIDILSYPTMNDDPDSVKKAKSAYRACLNVETSPTRFSPELRTVHEFGGMPLIASPSALGDYTEFSWNEIGDLVGKYGLSLIFIYRVAQLSQNETVIVMSGDDLVNPSLFRSPVGRSYDEVIEEDFGRLARRRVQRDTTVAPFDVFLRTVSRNLLKHTNPGKTDEEMIVELDEMANFMRQLYAGGISAETILPLNTEVTVEELQEWTDNQFSETHKINWLTYLNNVFQLSGVEITKTTKILHNNAERLFGILNLVQQTDPKIVKNFALLRIFLFQAPDSNHATRTAFEDYYKARNYKLYPRPEYCARKLLDVVDTGSLSYAVAHDFQRYHHNVSKVTEVKEMIQNIRDAFEEIVASVDWLEGESRLAALEKAKNMLVLVGYPDFVTDEVDLDRFYEKLRICENDSYGNARRIRAFRQAYQFSQLRSLYRDFWDKSPFEPNAYYNRPNNKIVIPIAMANPVFFYGNPILDYSRLGSIIGHEITHGFDVNGRNYDQNGLLQPWWTNPTTQFFNEKTICFREQYDKYYIPEIDSYVNGSYCLNENLADNGGIQVSLQAFQNFVQDSDVQADGDYSLEQLFFIGYGTMWCSEESDDGLRLIVSTVNGYPPKRFRVIGSLSNVEEFSQAFGCKVGSGMNPEEKCAMW